MTAGMAAMTMSVTAETALSPYTEAMYVSRLAHTPSTLGSHWARTGVHMNVTQRTKANVRAVMTAAVDLRVQVTLADVLKRSSRKATETLTPQSVRRYIICATKKARPQRGRSWAGLGRLVMWWPPPWDVWTGTIAAKTVRNACDGLVRIYRFCWWWLRQWWYRFTNAEGLTMPMVIK
jgi:hypothetical protein